MKRKLCIVSNIEWDMEHTVETDPVEYTTLPTEVTICDDFADEEDRVVEQIGEYLSEDFGYCTLGFTYKFIDENTGKEIK